MNNIFNVDNDFINAYIKTNVEKIRNTKFSIPTLIFGPVYFFYRKMNNYGVLWMLVMSIPNIITSKLELPNSIYSILYYIVNAVVAYFFKDIYMNDVENNVNKIIATNNGKPKEQIMSILSEKGGVSKSMSVISVIFFIAVIMFYFFSQRFRYINVSKII